MLYLKGVIPLLLSLSPILSAACAARQPGVLGRAVTITALDADRKETRGELLAVDQGQLVVRGPAAVERLPLAAVRDVQVERHSFGYKKGLIWSAVGGLVTGTGLWASCRTQPGNKCWPVGLGVFSLWMAVGGVSSLSMESTTHFHLARPKDEELRIYARFPQGLPPGFDIDSLVPPALRRPKVDASPPGQAPSPSFTFTPGCATLALRVALAECRLARTNEDHER